MASKMSFHTILGYSDFPKEILKKPVDSSEGGIFLREKQAGRGRPEMRLQTRHCVTRDIR
jgi:hypothetical protein